MIAWVWLLLGSKNSVLAQAAGALPSIRYEAAAACPAQSVFAERMRTRLKLAGSPVAAGISLRVVLTERGAATHGSVEIERGATKTQRSVDGARCEEVADALALIAALAISEQDAETPRDDDAKHRRARKSDKTGPGAPQRRSKASRGGDQARRDTRAAGPAAGERDLTLTPPNVNAESGVDATAPGRDATTAPDRSTATEGAASGTQSGASTMAATPQNGTPSPRGGTPAARSSAPTTPTTGAAPARNGAPETPTGAVSARNGPPTTPTGAVSARNEAPAAQSGAPSARNEAPAAQSGVAASPSRVTAAPSSEVSAGGRLPAAQSGESAAVSGEANAPPRQNPSAANVSGSRELAPAMSKDTDQGDDAHSDTKPWHVRPSIGAAVAVFSGLAPRMQPGLQLQAALTLSSDAVAWSLQLGGRIALDDHLVSPNGDAWFGFMAGFVSVCGASSLGTTRLALGGCAVAEPGEFSTGGANTINKRSHSRLWLAAGAAANVSVGVATWLRLRAGAELLAPFRRDRVSLAGETLYRIPALGLRLHLGLEVPFG